MYVPSDDLWEPQRRGILATIDAIQRRKDVILQSPTGSGKTRMAIELFRWAQSAGLTGTFCVNRKVLVGQTSDRFTDAGLPHGIRSAEYDDRYDPSKPFQVCSVPSEIARAYGKKLVWSRFNAGLVVVDEAHIQRGKNMRQYIEDQKSRGARIVLLTATPVGMLSMADELVVAGRMGEFRRCGAIVPAIVKTISNPDMSKVQRNKTGEFVMDGKKKSIYTQTIVGDVVERWQKYNPDGRPTVLYAPGVAESVWITEKFRSRGIEWAHVDAVDAVIDGEKRKLTRPVWDELIERYKAGDIKGISSRMKMREGIDVPATYCCILATPIGSLASYIQTVGRALRGSPGKDHALVIDHGGNFLRHGSPNADRPWSEWWKLPERAVSEIHTQQIRDGKEPEPIRCPKCEGERLSGPKCPHCGFEHPKGVRRVVMEDGTFETHEGSLIPQRRVKCNDDTEAKWKKMYFGFFHGKKDKTFNQMYAFFHHTHKYAPPRDLPFMPKTPEGWMRKVHLVSRDELTSSRPAETVQ